MHTFLFSQPPCDLSDILKKEKRKRRGSEFWRAWRKHRELSTPVFFSFYCWSAASLISHQLCSCCSPRYEERSAFLFVPNSKLSECSLFFFFVSPFLHLIAFLLEDVPCSFFFFWDHVFFFFFLLVLVGALRVPLPQLYTSTALLCNGNRLHADISIWIMVIPYNFHWASVVWSRTFLPTSIQLLSPDPRVNEESKKKKTHTHKRGSSLFF